MIATYIFLSFIGLLILTGFCFYIFWKYRRTPYTRERFAFVSASLGFALLMALFPFIFGTANWINYLIEVVNNIFNWEINRFEPSPSDRIIAAIIFFLYCKLVVWLFRSWDYPKSIHQYAQEKTKESPSYFEDIIILLKKKEDINLHVAETEEFEFPIQFPKEEQIAWNIKAAQYIILINRQIKAKKDDWHQEQSCYISSFTDNKTVAIFCQLEEPSTAKLQKFIKYVREVKGGTVFKYYCLVKNGNSDCKEITVNETSITIRYENEILNHLIDFSDYYQYIINYFENNEIIEGYQYSLSDIYAEPSCRIRLRHTNGESSEEIITDLEGYINQWLQNKKEKKHLALLGEYGQGKSVLAHKICYDIITKRIQSDRIPVIIELRGKFPKQFTDTIKLLADWCSNYGIDPNALFRLHVAGKLLIIFDGFDEMELVGDYSIRLEHFRKIWEFSYPNSKIIITGRPNYFLNDNELKTILKTAEEHSNTPHCEEVYINMFDRKRIEQALRNIDEETRKDILELLASPETNKSFIDLISRPALLFLTSIVWKERNLSSFKKNINSATVIEEFIKQTYERQESKGVKTPLSALERSYFMLGIAMNMVKTSRYTNQITASELTGTIEKLLENFPDELTRRNLSQNPRTSKVLKERFEQRYNAETVSLDIRACGILVRDLATFDSFKFAHKSFLEYLVSFYYSNIIIGFRQNENDRLIVQTIKNTFLIEPSDIAKTPEVFRFILQLIAKRVDLSMAKSDQEKIHIIFRLLYPHKLIGLKVASRIIPIAGRDLRKAIVRTTVSIIVFSVVLLVILMSGGFSYFSNFLFSLNMWLLFLGIFSVYYILPLYIENKHYSRLSKIKLSNIVFFENFLNDVIQIFQGNKFTVPDNGNFNLWYQTCMEIGINKDEIRSLIPQKLFHQLDEYYRATVSQKSEIV